MPTLQPLDALSASGNIVSMMANITRQRARKVARNDAKAAARLIAVQEQQIAALEAENAAQDAVILGICEQYVWDHVDSRTGEVKKGWQ